jgi:predicted transcriptional regulator
MWIRDTMPTKFYSLFKRRGFGETLQILGTFENHEAIQSKFFERFEKEGESYYNAYLRVRKALLDAGLIKFKLNENNEKMIYLTEKGQQLLSKLGEIEKII